MVISYEVFPVHLISRLLLSVKIVSNRCIPYRSIVGILKNIAAQKIKAIISAANVKDTLFLVVLHNPDHHVSELSFMFPCMQPVSKPKAQYSLEQVMFSL